jgi:hypothetical protein
MQFLLAILLTLLAQLSTFVKSTFAHINAVFQTWSFAETMTLIRILEIINRDFMYAGAKHVDGLFHFCYQIPTNDNTWTGRPERIITTLSDVPPPPPPLRRAQNTWERHVASCEEVAEMMRVTSVTPLDDGTFSVVFQDHESGGLSEMCKWLFQFCQTHENGFLSEVRDFFRQTNESDTVHEPW